MHNDRMVKQYFIIIMMVFIIGVVGASDYIPHQINTPLYFSVNSDNATQCNATNMDTPNQTRIINTLMTKNGQTFNTTIKETNFTYTGIYCINIQCSDGINIETGSICREVTQTGNSLNIEQVLMYILIFVCMLGFFLLFLYGAMEIPMQNIRNSDGETLLINWKKYLKLFCALLSYVSFVWIIFFAWNISWAYLQWTTLSTFFKYLFYLVFALTFPVFVAIIIIGITNYATDKNLNKYMDDFVRVGSGG